MTIGPVAYTRYKDAAFPPLFNREIVFLDARADEGEDEPVLLGERLEQGRRVFASEAGFPAPCCPAWRSRGSRRVRIRARDGSGYGSDQLTFATKMPVRDQGGWR